jgi:two-component system, NarL family, invasion response regulator UvrY
MIHVAVADDYALIRSALRRFFEFEPGFSWAGEARDGEDALQLVTRHVDVLILDLGMPGAGGLDALPRLRAAAPHLKVVILSAYPASAYARKAIALGASNYLEKSSDLDLIAATVRTAMTEDPPHVTGTIARGD